MSTELNPGMKLRKPGQRPLAESDVQALEARAEEIASKVPGEPVPKAKPAPTPSTSSVTAGPSRGGTIAAPRLRKDGTPTVSTTVTLPTELAAWLRQHVAIDHPGKKQSDIVCEALERYRRAVESL